MELSVVYNKAVLATVRVLEVNTCSEAIVNLVRSITRDALEKEKFVDFIGLRGDYKEVDNAELILMELNRVSISDISMSEREKLIVEILSNEVL